MTWGYGTMLGDTVACAISRCDRRRYIFGQPARAVSAMRRPRPVYRYKRKAQGTQAGAAAMRVLRGRSAVALERSPTVLVRAKQGDHRTPHGCLQDRTERIRPNTESGQRACPMDLKSATSHIAVLPRIDSLYRRQ